MSRRNIADLPMPAHGYRIDRIASPPGKPAFETRASAEDETLRRSNSLFKKARTLPRCQRRAAKGLARRLKNEIELGEASESMASSSFLRDLRVRVTGALWKLVDETDLEVAFVTLIPRNWEVPAGELHGFDPRAKLPALKTALYRCGAAKAEGWLIAFVHGEFEPNRGVYQMHVHCLAAGDMIEVLERLRSKRKTRPTCPIRPTRSRKEARVRCRLHIQRGITNSAYAISYLCKSFWPERWVGTKIDEHGKERRVRQRRVSRIGDPQHNEVLLWLDKHEPKDLSLLVHLRATRAGLTVTSPR